MGAADEHFAADGEARGGVGTGGAGGFVVHFHLLADGVKLGVGIDVPGIAEPGGAGDGGVAVGGNPYRRAGLLDGAQHQLGVAELEILAVVVDALAGPEQSHGGQAFQVAADAGTAGDAEVVVFRITVAQGGAEGKASAGDYVHSGNPFRQVDGVV